MFTGIVEEVGWVAGLRKTGGIVVLSVRAETVLEGTQTGDSICVNGVCLTVTSLSRSGKGGEFTVDVSKETLDRTTFRSLSVGDPLNLERSLTLSARLGGHLVSGHVDGVGKVAGIEKEGENVLMRFSAPGEVAGAVIEKGSIAVEGISLTAFQVTADGFTVTVIPHTLNRTNLKTKGIGASVNLECDMIGKYVKKFLSRPENPSPGKGITDDFLSEHGF